MNQYAVTVSFDADNSVTFKFYDVPIKDESLLHAKTLLQVIFDFASLWNTFFQCCVS